MVPMTQILRHLFYNWILTGFVIDSIWVTRVPASNLSRVDPSWLTSWKPICLRRPTSSSSLLIFLVKRSVLFKHINLNKSDYQYQTRMTRKRTDIVGQLVSVAPSDWTMNVIAHPSRENHILTASLVLSNTHPLLSTITYLHISTVWWFFLCLTAAQVSKSRKRTVNRFGYLPVPCLLHLYHLH